MPGEVAAVAALDKLVLHGWGLGQGHGWVVRLRTRKRRCRAPVHQLYARAGGPGSQGAPLFDPVVRLPGDAPAFDRALGVAGPNPDWSPRHPA
jgi:hypothetical protein